MVNTDYTTTLDVLIKVMRETTISHSLLIHDHSGRLVTLPDKVSTRIKLLYMTSCSTRYAKIMWVFKLSGKRHTATLTMTPFMRGYDDFEALANMASQFEDISALPTEFKTGLMYTLIIDCFFMVIEGYRMCGEHKTDIVIYRYKLN